VSVRRGENGTIVLDGDCVVGDAESLLQHLQSTPAALLDWTSASRVHTAVLQVVLAVRPPLAGPCGDPFIRQWLR
jgi:hypothetical protein